MVKAENSVASLLDLFNPELYRLSLPALPHFFAATVIMVMAAMVLRWERGSRVSLMFVGFSSLFVFWIIGHGLLMTFDTLPLLHYVATRMHVSVAIGIPLLVQFVLTLLHRDGPCRRVIWLNWVLGISFAVLARDTPLVHTGLRPDGGGYAPAYDWAGHAMLVWVLFLMLYLGAHFLSVLRASRAGTVERKRLAILGLAMLALYFAALSSFIVPSWADNHFDSCGVMFFAVLSAYVTRKYGLVEVNAQLVAGQLANMLQGAVLILDRESIVHFANEAAVKILGFSRSHLLGQPADARLGEAFSTQNLAALARAEHGESEKELVYRLPPSGQLRDLALSVVSVRDARDRPVAFVCLARDITEQKRAEKERARGQLIDPLTALPNRAMFLGLLDAAAERSQLEFAYTYAACFIGIDRMRVVNDDLGYAAGDSLLREVAERLRRAIRPQDTVARVGGDEFAVLIRAQSEPEQVAEYVERLRAQLKAPMEISGQKLFVSASIGATSSQGGPCSGAELLRNASIAMYQAKQDGSGGYHFIAAGEQRPQRLRLESELRQAIESGQIHAYYQPVVDLHERRVVGFEALARWEHPQRGLLLPAEFIDLAGELGLIADIDLQVLSAACRGLHQLRAQAPDRPPTLSFNLSEECLRLPQIDGRLLQLLTANNLPAESLRIELLERMVQVEPVRLTLQTLRDLGLGLYVDDFGTGYSALSRLHDMPLTALKIDREFVRAMARGQGGDKVVRGIVALARSLGLEVIAEGVSTADEAARLFEAGCRYVQGFYFSPAMPLEQALALCREAQPYADRFAPVPAPRAAIGVAST